MNEKNGTQPTRWEIKVMIGFITVLLAIISYFAVNAYDSLLNSDSQAKADINLIFRQHQAFATNMYLICNALKQPCVQIPEK